MGWKIARAVVLVVAFAVALMTHVDWFPGMATYGFSVGTNLSYCSVELVHGHLGAGCQSGQ